MMTPKRRLLTLIMMMMMINSKRVKHLIRPLHFPITVQHCCNTHLNIKHHHLKPDIQGKLTQQNHQVSQVLNCE